MKSLKISVIAAILTPVQHLLTRSITINELPTLMGNMHHMHGPTLSSQYHDVKYDINCANLPINGT